MITYSIISSSRHVLSHLDRSHREWCRGTIQLMLTWMNLKKNKITDMDTTFKITMKIMMNTEKAGINLDSTKQLIKERLPNNIEKDATLSSNMYENLKKTKTLTMNMRKRITIRNWQSIMT